MSTAPKKHSLAIHRKDERKLQWSTIFIIGLIHLLALMAFDLDYFSVSGLVVGIVMYYVAGMVGVTISYHRLLTHRSFQTYKPVEYFFTFCACQALQSGPIEWVAMHRIHHKESDEEPDPHSPLVSFLWAHAGWLFVNLPDAHTYDEYSRFAKDLHRDPWQRFFDKFFFVIYLLTAVAIYFAGEWYGGLGMSWLVWGVFVRTVVLWHNTWAVNSVTHTFGYRNYNTDEESTNNWLVALLSFGEGWHNNHHADQRSAAHGQRWFEVDITYRLIKMMELVGLVWGVREPSQRVVAKRLDIMVDEEGLRASEARRLGSEEVRAEILHTMTDPTIPLEIPRMPSLTEASEAAAKSAQKAMESVGTALEHASHALRHKEENTDQAVRQMLEKAKDLAMAAVEQAKYAAAEAAEFSAQASAYLADAKDRATESAHQAAERAKALAQEAADAASKAADEIAVAFKGIDRPVITSAI